MYEVKQSLCQLFYSLQPVIHVVSQDNLLTSTSLENNTYIQAECAPLGKQEMAVRDHAVGGVTGHGIQLTGQISQGSEGNAGNRDATHSHLRFIFIL